MMPHALCNGIFKNAVLACAGAAALSTVALAFAFYMQYGQGLEPCHLCLMQRWPYGLTIVLGLAGLIATLRGRARIGGHIVLACALVFLAEGGLAFYHVGVEQHWWKSIFASCTISFATGGDILAQIEAAPPARCDEVAWQFLGLSMAGWNIIFALGLSAISALFACAIRRDNPV
jgi:disulfide bond formation protein DsbB